MDTLVPFQLWLFLIASGLNLLLATTGLIGVSIEGAVRLIAAEPALFDQSDPKADTNSGEDEDLSERPPFGKVVGFIERELFLYALFVSLPEIISGVLLFKAFSGWIATSSSRVNKDSDKGKEKDLRVLARFYCYAIGNFVSLLWAFLLFELMRWAMHYPSARALLWIDVP